MDDYEKNYLSQRPQELCHMCGKCCKVVTTSIPYKQLLKMKENGDSGATDFLEIFEPFDSVEDARNLCPDIVENIIERFKKNSKPTDNLEFYTCRFLGEDNLCRIYKNRKTLCKHFPSTPWAIVPPGCGFEAWLFLKREEAKQKVRKLKEELIELALLRTKVTDEQVLSKISSVEEKINDIINKYKKYGSEDW